MNKKAVLMILLVMIAFCLISCESNSFSQETTQENLKNEVTVNSNYASITIPFADGTLSDLPPTLSPEIVTEHYSISYEQGKTLLKFKSDIQDDLSNNGWSSMEIVPFLDFDTISQFKEKIASGNLSKEQLSIINSFVKDPETDKVLLCNINQLYEPIVPRAIVDKVTLWGRYYSFTLSWEAGGHGAFLVYDSNCRSIFDTDLQKEIKKLTDPKSATITSRTQIAERNAEIFIRENSKGIQKNIVYSFQNSSGNFIIIEDYILENAILPTSDSIPYRVAIFMQSDNGIFASCSVFGLTVRPSYEDLTSIQFRPFAGNPSNDHVTE